MNCGKNILSNPEITIHLKIHTHGCLTVMEQVLLRDVGPLLLGIVGLSLISGILQILLIASGSTFVSKYFKKDDNGERYANETEQQTMSSIFDEYRRRTMDSSV